MNKLNLKTLKQGDAIRVRYMDGPWYEFTFGSSAGYGALEGAFYWAVSYDSGYLVRRVGARIDETGAVYAARGWEVELVKKGN